MVVYKGICSHQADLQGTERKRKHLLHFPKCMQRHSHINIIRRGYRERAWLGRGPALLNGRDWTHKIHLLLNSFFLFPMPSRRAFQLSTSISSYNLDGKALLFKPREYKAEMTDDSCLQLGLEYSYVLRVLEEEEALGLIKMLSVHYGIGHEVVTCVQQNGSQRWMSSTDNDQGVKMVPPKPSVDLV